MSSQVNANSTRLAQHQYDVDCIARETFAKRIDYSVSLPSTNTRALELASNCDSLLPSLILTDRQTAGRGRGTNSWWSARGSITFSLVLDLESSLSRPESWPKTALAASIAICDALEILAPSCRFGIRWPNDVFIGPRKICGVLPELHMGPSPRLVLGVGININNHVSQAPDEISERATSLLELTGRQVDLTNAIVIVLNRIETRLDQLYRGDAELPLDWGKRCLLRGESVQIQINSDTVTGLCEGIDSAGALCLKTARGVERFYGGTIARVG